MKNRRVWIAAVVLASVLAGGEAWRRSRPKYLRYVSAPLKDGTRYTFLYPARVGRMASSGPFVIMDGESPPLLDLARERLSGTRARKLLGQGDLVLIAMGGTRLSEPRVARRSQSFPSSLYTVLYDTRSGRFFTLMHTNRSAPRQAFEAEARIVSDSFHIVPPGAPAPSP